MGDLKVPFDDKYHQPAFSLKLVMEMAPFQRITFFFLFLSSVPEMKCRLRLWGDLSLSFGPLSLQCSI